MTTLTLKSDTPTRIHKSGDGSLHGQEHWAKAGTPCQIAETRPNGRVLIAVEAERTIFWAWLDQDRIDGMEGY